MARPKSDDPTVAVQFRMKKSARDRWQGRADEAGMKLHKLLQQVTENRASRPDPWTAEGIKANAITAEKIRNTASGGTIGDPDVLPNFKGKS
jgi:hypothetical protein